MLSSVILNEKMLFGKIEGSHVSSMPLSSVASEGTKWTKFSDNPLTSLRAGLSSPWVIFDGLTYKMWFTKVSINGIYYASSSDGISWTSAVKVFESGESGSWEEKVSGPCVIYDGTIYKMWYTGSRAGVSKMGYATSSDGINWVKYSGNPVLVPGGNGGWDDWNTWGSNVLFDGSTYMMWYSGEQVRDGTRRIGFATSTDGITWVKYSGNPVIVPSSGWDSKFVHAGPVIKEGPTYKMWYTARDGGIWRIGLAESSDGITWQKYYGNPVLDREPSIWESHAVIEPSVVLVGDTYKMWYIGSDGTAQKIGLAFSSVAEEYPDLVISDISWEPSSPIVGDSVIFSYLIENQGNMDADSFTTALYIDGERIDISARRPLSVGAMETRSFTYAWTGTEGSHTIEVVADDLDEILESDENNNKMNKNLIIKPIEVSAEITSYQIASGTFFAGNTVAASVTVRNGGNVKWTYYVGYSVQDPHGNWWDAPYATITLNTEDSGSVTLYWDVPIGALEGDYKARVAVWKSESGGELQDRLDMKEEQDAFYIYVPMVEKLYNIRVNVWVSSKVTGVVLVYVYDDNGNLVNQKYQDAGSGSGPYHFDFFVLGPYSGGRYRIGTALFYEAPDSMFPDIPASTEITFWLEEDVVIDLYPSIPEMNTVVTLQEFQHKLLLHIYDSQGRHIGINHDLNRLENGIPGSYYIDHLNGTISIILPSNVTEFQYVVDAKYAREPTENYNIKISTVKGEEIIFNTTKGGTINQDERYESDFINLGENVEDVWWMIPIAGVPMYFVIVGIIIAIIVIAFVLAIKRRKVVKRPCARKRFWDFQPSNFKTVIFSRFFLPKWLKLRFFFILGHGYCISRGAG